MRPKVDRPLSLQRMHGRHDARPIPILPAKSAAYP